MTGHASDVAGGSAASGHDSNAVSAPGQPTGRVPRATAAPVPDAAFLPFSLTAAAAIHRQRTAIAAAAVLATGAFEESTEPETDLESESEPGAAAGRGEGGGKVSEREPGAALGASDRAESMDMVETPVAGGPQDSEVQRKSTAHAKPGNLVPPPEYSFLSRRPRVLLAASGSVAAIKFPIIVHSVSEWAEVRAVCTSSALHFVEPQSLPAGVPLLTDDDEWKGWNRLGDPVLHIELRKWADVMVIAPLSANTLAKVANGMCDNLLTCIVRAWDFKKPLLVAPAMNTHMWNSTFTNRHLQTLKDLGVVLSSPVSKTLACGDVGTGAMAEPAAIEGAIRRAVSSLDTRG